MLPVLVISAYHPPPGDFTVDIGEFLTAVVIQICNLSEWNIIFITGNTEDDAYWNEE